jgi:N-acetylglucosaminylphosphatidylinositol deacetylase family protein
LVNRFVRSNELFYVVPVSDVHQEDSYQKIVQCG